MAEAVAALSVAANVLQFVDFGTKVANKFHDLYNSTTTYLTSEEHNILVVNAAFKASLSSVERASDECVDTDGSQNLKPLVEQCQKTALLLDNMLQPLVKAYEHDQKRGKRQTLKLAFKAIWHEDDVKLLRDQMHQLRNELTFHLLMSFR